MKFKKKGRYANEVWVLTAPGVFPDFDPKAIGVHNDFFEGAAHYVLASYRNEEVDFMQAQVDTMKADVQRLKFEHSRNKIPQSKANNLLRRKKVKT